MDEERAPFGEWRDPHEEDLFALPRSTRERLTWQLVSALMTRHGRQLAPVQHHYYSSDIIVLVDRGARPGSVELLGLNRNGYGHALPWTEHHRAYPEMWHRSLEATGVGRMASTLARAAKLGPPMKGNAIRPDTLAYRSIAAFFEIAPDAERWRCVNGQLDTNFGEGGVQHHLFSSYPMVAQLLSEQRANDLLGHSAFRFWFLCRGEDPLAVLEPEAGRAWRCDGSEVDIAAVSHSGRQTWAVAHTLREAL